MKDKCIYSLVLVILVSVLQFFLANSIKFGDGTIFFNSHGINGTIQLSEDKTHIRIYYNNSNLSNNTFLIIIGNGASANISIGQFCKDANCSIPIMIGGRVSIEIRSFRHSIYKMNLFLPQHSVFCEGDIWPNRQCELRNVCYQQMKLSVYSPYKIDFSNPLLSLSAKQPPTDNVFLRINSSQIQTIKSLPSDTITYMPHSHLLVNIPNPGMLWHVFYDFLLPLVKTLDLPNKFDHERRLFFMPHSSFMITPLLEYIVKNKWKVLNSPMCFSHLSLGVKKVTYLHEYWKEPIHPPHLWRDAIYDFDYHSISKLQSLVLKGIGYMEENSSKPLLIVVQRNAKTRVLKNFQDIVSVLKRVFIGFDILEIDFEKMKLNEQIRLSARASIIVGAHGSGLAHQIWMRKGSGTIEIFPYKFTCRDWYEKAAIAGGLKYMSYFPDSTLESPDSSPEMHQCWSGKINCLSLLCLDRLLSQNISVDIPRFESQITSIWTQWAKRKIINNQKIENAIL